MNTGLPLRSSERVGRDSPVTASDHGEEICTPQGMWHRLWEDGRIAQDLKATGKPSLRAPYFKGNRHHKILENLGF